MRPITSSTGSPAAGRARRGRLAGGALAAAAAAAALTAPPASAALQRCVDLGVGVDPGAKCARITGVAAGSYLNSRAAPFTNAAVTGRYRNGDVIEVGCWAAGSVVNGDRYWVGIPYAGGERYVADWYVTTGNPAVWTKQLLPC